jgi:DNA-3-methyladenine glycosylase
MRGLPAGTGLPWHRVIGGDGFLRPQAGGAFGIETQRALLRREGVRVRRDGWLALSRFGWNGADGAARIVPRRGQRAAMLPLSFFRRPVLQVARDLLGCLLVRQLGNGRERIGRIVEVEAYNGTKDLACHASRGRTRRTEPLFGPPGHAYVYLIYGMYNCLNVVTGPIGYPAAVLLRAAELIDHDGALAHPRAASGPGRLCRCFEVDLRLNRCDLRRGELVIRRGPRPPRRAIARGPRVGVDYAGAWARKPWRFALPGSPALSVPLWARPSQSR